MTFRFKWTAIGVAFGAAVFAMTIWHYEGRLKESSAEREVDLRALARAAGRDFWAICQSPAQGVGVLAPRSTTGFVRAPFDQFVLDDPTSALFDGFSSVARSTMSYCLLQFVGIDEAKRLNMELVDRFFDASKAAREFTDPVKRAQVHFDAWQWYIDAYEARVTSSYVYRR